MPTSRNRVNTLALLVVLLVLAALMVSGPACGGGSGSKSDSVFWPTDGWRTSTPEEQGVNSTLLVQMLDDIEHEDLNFHSVLVIRHGYVVLDASFYPFEAGTRHDLASVTKSFTSTLIGVAIQQGSLKSVDEPVLSLFPDRTIANVDESKRTMTVEDLLTMSSGLECINEPTEVALGQMMTSPDWVQFALDLPMAEEPGTRFNYCSPGVHLLSGIIRQATGMSALDFAREQLFAPLGITDVEWPEDAQGNNHGWGDLELTPRDAGKLGYLYLKGGVWDGQQVLPPEWVQSATTTHASPPPIAGVDRGYGYLWWLSPGVYSVALGRGGQSIFVIPEKDMVVVLTGGNPDVLSTNHRLVTSFLIPAAESESPLPANSGAAAQLQSRVRQLATPNVPSAASPAAMARAVSGRTYDMAGTMGILAEPAFSLEFAGDNTAQLNVGTSAQFPVGLNGAVAFMPGRLGAPMGITGEWVTDSAFVLYVDEIAHINRWRYIFSFREGGGLVTVVMEETTGLMGPRSIDGVPR